MAAASCFVTTFRRNLENELPADTEQCPPRSIALGLDHADFLTAMAPRPVAILSQERDYFDVRGAAEAATRLRQVYKLLGAEEHVLHFIGPNPHGYSQENREAMYGWFNKATGISDAKSEPKLTIEKDETLLCTPHGQVAELKSRSVFSFTSECSQSLAKTRKKLSGDPLKQAVSKVLRLPKLPDEPPDFRILRPVRNRNYPKRLATTYAVETEPGIFAVVTRLYDQSNLSRPPQTPVPAILYVSHHSADAELREEPLVKELLEASPDAAFYACDVRGIGESRPDTCGSDQFLSPYGSDYFYAAHSIMLDRPYVGQKTFDLLQVLQWIHQFGHREIHVVALGWGAIPAAFASLLSPHATQVTLKRGLSSYAAVAESENYRWPLSCFVPGVLAKFELPECYRELEQRKQLKMIEPRGGEGPQ